MNPRKVLVSVGLGLLALVLLAGSHPAVYRSPDGSCEAAWAIRWVCSDR